ncbi:hypothetical protein B0I35DRAFT_427467 [Stachybotrys elegans]|uniref:Uncharacterized protein n=1 Tax=Stachybotrys elegans TaxID=80388 RepID=A0A8K0STV5_9HYPO|nr:hypothetical protein B0I35DRAFT_427467 [Stachybotrys elegans]
MEFHYIIAFAAAASGQIVDLESFPPAHPELNATKSCQNRTLMLNTKANNELVFSSSFHLSIALTGSLLLIFSLLWVKQHGYTLSERWYCSTDDIMWLIMGFIVIPWSVILPISTLKWDNCEGVYHLQTPTGWQGYQFWARMAFAPWLLDGVFLWWFMERFVFFLCRAGKAKRHRWLEITLVLVPTGIAVIWAAAGALHSRLFLLGLLTIAGFILFIVVLYKSYDNPCYDTDNSHRYAMDDIRIPLLSAGQTGLAHVLPSVKPWYTCDPTSPFRLVVTYSLICEQMILNDNKEFFEPVDIDTNTLSLESCRASMNRIVTGLISKIPDDEKRLRHLASWLYPRDPTPRPTSDTHRCEQPSSRQKNSGRSITEGFSSLIGRDILLALQVWEQLVFDRRWQLSCGKCQGPKPCGKCTDLRELVWTLREPKYAGAQATSRDPRPPTRGIPDPLIPLAGLQEAATEVHRILYPDEDEDKEKNERPQIDISNILENMDLSPPSHSISGIQADSLSDYAGKLWKSCWAAYPSTLGALYLWTTVWYIDMGNRGFHTTPLLPQDGETFNLWLDYVPGYLTSWRIRWRYVWHNSILCQLIIMLPTLLSGFISLGI